MTTSLALRSVAPTSIDSVSAASAASHWPDRHHLNQWVSAIYWGETEHSGLVSSWIGHPYLPRLHLSVRVPVNTLYSFFVLFFNTSIFNMEAKKSNHLAAGPVIPMLDSLRPRHNVIHKVSCPAEMQLQDPSEEKKPSPVAKICGFYFILLREST